MTITAELMTDPDRRKAEYPCLSFASPECEEHFNKVCRFAESVGALAYFERRVRYLATYAQPHRVTECVLCSDFAPYSFGFCVREWIEAPEGKRWWEPFMRGGLIYSGPGQPLDGSGPAFTVSLSPSKNLHDWSVHT